MDINYIACAYRTINSGVKQMKMVIFQLIIYVLVTIIFMHGLLVLLVITGMMLSLTLLQVFANFHSENKFLFPLRNIFVTRHVC